MRFVKLFALSSVVALVPQLAFAHVGVGDAHGLTHGFMHPISGIDHILAMIAVGMFAANLGGRALWLAPATFVVMMAMGGAMGVFHVELPYVELGIAASVILLGVAVASRAPLPTAVAMAVVGVFAIYHGHAHGSEMPIDASGAAYAAGFMAATALLHVVGIGVGLSIGMADKTSAVRLNRLGGAGIALAGVGLLIGWI